MKLIDLSVPRKTVRSFLWLAAVPVLCGTAHVHAARFSIQDYGATADDQSDNTLAVLKMLQSCAAAGGGEVFVPAGIYVISRQGAESPILEVPSNTTLLGEGADSTLKFDPRSIRVTFGGY